MIRYTAGVKTKSHNFFFFFYLKAPELDDRASSRYKIFILSKPRILGQFLQLKGEKPIYTICNQYNIFPFFSQQHPFICTFFFYICSHFSTLSCYHCFRVEVSLHSNQSLFLREPIFVGFNKFLFLICWCIIIHQHWPQVPIKMGFYVYTCSLMYVQTQDLLF